MAKLAKHTPGDGLAASLAKEYGITGKAIRDIWTLRTWANTTRPYWTAADEQQFATRTASKRPKKHHIGFWLCLLELV